MNELEKNNPVIYGESQEKVKQILSGKDFPNEVSQIQQIRYAGFWVRFAAYCIDKIITAPIVGIIFSVVSIFSKKFLSRENSFYQIEEFISYVIIFPVMWSYFIFMTYKYKATLGKMILGIKVVSDKEAELNLGQIILREIIGKLISSLSFSIGYIIAAFTNKKQALHDIIAHTTVVYKNSNKKNNGCIIAGSIIGCLMPLLIMVGILISVFLTSFFVSLNVAREKANDAEIKSKIASIIPSAIIYIDEKGTLLGFESTLEFIKMPECSEQPIVNISKDGKEMAVFGKLCEKEGMYFCFDINSNSLEVDEEYIKSGATICEEYFLENKKDVGIDYIIEDRF